MKIALNQTEQLKHGWYCVRNRSTDEVSSGVSIIKRHENERAFFATSPWDKLDKRRVGVDALRHNLGLLLNQHISREFPLIRKEIEAQFVQSRKNLEELGAPRQTAHEQLQYLIRIATAYQDLVRKNLGGHYETTGLDPSKLRMHLQNAGDRFSDKMLKDGCTMKFKSVDESLSDTAEEDLDSNPSVLTQNNSGVFDASEDGRDGEESDNHDIYKEILKLWRTNRGPELPGKISLILGSSSY